MSINNSPLRSEQENEQHGQKGENESVDMEKLERLRSSMSKLGAQAFAELIHSYLGEAEYRVAQMQQALSQSNLADLQLAAHTLRSSSALVGATHLSQLCQELETSIRTESELERGQSPNVYQMLSQIVAEYNGVKSRLETELAE